MPDREHGSLGRRPSEKWGSHADEIHSPGLQSIWAGEGDKEVYHIVPTSVPTPDQHMDAGDSGQEKRRICGLRRGTFVAVVLLAVIAAIGLGVGLGVGLGMKHSSNDASQAQSTANQSAYEIGGALNTAYYSTHGAWNGSGIALASESFDGTTHGELVMYFQHWSGQIRWQELNDKGQWVGGDITTVVASDAKNSTPLSAVAYALNQTSTVSAPVEAPLSHQN